MSEDLRALESWAGALLAKLQPAQRRAINYKVALDLRRSQAQRIKAQHGPDGKAYPPRKQRKELRRKKGHIKRKKMQMFAKIRTTKYLKITAVQDGIEVGFLGKIARIARVHHFGEEEHISSQSKTLKYPERPLLGISEKDRTVIRESFLKQFFI